MDKNLQQPHTHTVHPTKCWKHVNNLTGKNSKSLYTLIQNNRAPHIHTDKEYVHPLLIHQPSTTPSS